MQTIMVREVMDSPEVSYWLKNALTSALHRDPVDAVADAELLLRILEDVRDQALGAAEFLARADG